MSGRNRLYGTTIETSKIVVISSKCNFLLLILLYFRNLRQNHCLELKSNRISKANLIRSFTVNLKTNILSAVNFVSP